MKKFISSLVVSLFILGLFVSFGSSNAWARVDKIRPCKAIWDNVCDNTYVFEIDGISYDVYFNDSGVGPCPQATCDISVTDGDFIGSCRYTSDGNKGVIINCGGASIKFLLCGNKLIYLAPGSLVLESN